MLVQEKSYQNGIILKDKKLKVLTYVIFCRPEVQYMYRLIILFSILQGRIVTLGRFFDSDQKRIEQIYRYRF